LQINSPRIDIGFYMVGYRLAKQFSFHADATWEHISVFQVTKLANLDEITIIQLNMPVGFLSPYETIRY